MPPNHCATEQHNIRPRIAGCPFSARRVGQKSFIQRQSFDLSTTFEQSAAQKLAAILTTANQPMLTRHCLQYRQRQHAFAIFLRRDVYAQALSLKHRRRCHSDRHAGQRVRPLRPVIAHRRHAITRGIGANKNHAIITIKRENLRTRYGIKR